MKTTAAILIGICVTALAACQTGPTNRGTTGHRMDPTHDSPTELGVKSLRSADLVEATDRMMMDIASREDISSPISPPKIVLGRVENRTSMPYQNWDVFLARTRAQLQRSASRGGVEFKAERARVEQMRNREYGGKTPGSTASEYESEADYMLALEVYDLPSGGTNYFLLDYQLIQLRPSATGPDVGSGAIVWENQYEVKFQ